MGVREQLSRDKSNTTSLQWKSERQGSVDRVTAVGIVAAQGHREAAIEALGCALWGYKLLWNRPAANGDEFTAMQRKLAERDKHEAYLRLSCILQNTKQLKDFGGPRNGTKIIVNRSGWFIGGRAAIEEWVNDLCRNCHGAGEIIIGGVRKTCPVCDGHRKHRYSDEERGDEFMRWLSVWPKDEAPDIDIKRWNDLLFHAHDIIGAADRAMAARMGRLLGRD